MTEKITSTAAYIGSGGSIICGLTINELAAWIGIIVAIATFGLNAWFQWRRDRREEWLMRRKT